MAAHVGIENTGGTLDNFDISAPSGGYVNEAEQDQSVDVATVRDENGVTKVALPKKMITETQTIKGKGDAGLAAVTAGAFSAGTIKIISAKQTETNDDFPDFEIVGKKYSDMA